MAGQDWFKGARAHPGAGGDEMNTAAPIGVVGSVSIELERLSSLCNVLTLISANDSEVETTDVSNAMGVIRDCLDIQIKALDGIDWKR